MESVMIGACMVAHTSAGVGPGAGRSGSDSPTRPRAAPRYRAVMGPLWKVLASVTVVSAIPLLVVWVLPRDEQRLRRTVSYLVSFAIGALLGGALLHLVPESYERLGTGTGTGVAVLAGFLAFFLLERFLWLHGHTAPQPSARRIPPLALLNVIGDGAHNFMDGAAIAASWIASPALGLSTTLAVILHEVPQELGDYGVLLHSGLPVRRAVLYNLGSALVAYAGAAVVFGAERFAGSLVGIMLPLAAGNFLYIAASDLVPELQRARSIAGTIEQVAVIVLGVGVMVVTA